MYMNMGWQLRFPPFSEQGTASPEQSMLQSTLQIKTGVVVGMRQQRDGDIGVSENSNGGERMNLKEIIGETTDYDKKVALEVIMK